MVMLILKRHYQFWFSIIALHKLGATVIPATHLLTEKDIIYRCKMAGIKAIVATGDKIVVDHIQKAMPDCPTVKALISTGPIIPEGWYDFNKSIDEAKPFVRPEQVNTNDDISLLYFNRAQQASQKWWLTTSPIPRSHNHRKLLAQPE